MVPARTNRPMARAVKVFVHDPRLYTVSASGSHEAIVFGYPKPQEKPLRPSRRIPTEKEGLWNTSKISLMTETAASSLLQRISWMPKVVFDCIYGTAEKSSPSLIFEAVQHGYRGIGTACQPEYYHEDIVGQALDRRFLTEAIEGLGLNCGKAYLQTKFTTPAAQTFENAPYGTKDSLPVKVDKRIRMSLLNLRVTWVDTLLLRRPMPTIEETIEAWTAMKTHVPDRARNIGLSIVSLEQTQAICKHAKI